MLYHSKFCDNFNYSGNGLFVFQPKACFHTIDVLFTCVELILIASKKRSFCQCGLFCIDVKLKL